MLCRFMSSTSATMVSSVRVRPVSGCHSWRLTPRSEIGLPFTVRTPSTTATVRKPMRSGIRSPASETSSPVYRRGCSSDQGSTPSITYGPAGSASDMPSSGTDSDTRQGAVTSTARVPCRVVWS